MHRCVICKRLEFQVIYFIICLITIFVVNQFPWIKATANLMFDYNTAFTSRNTTTILVYI